ncbi:Sakacin A production response regulator [Streptococcus sp. DD10]|nr:Sakacin A production response regulator [Streptococcus sp. DD10]
MYAAIQGFIDLQGRKYLAPQKAGDLGDVMVSYKETGQAARAEFTNLAKDFQAFYPRLQLQRVSNWMNQAQILRPHFWVYLQGYGDLTEPMFALRLYGTAQDFGISLEVSFIERKKMKPVS